MELSISLPSSFKPGLRKRISLFFPAGVSVHSLKPFDSATAHERVGSHVAILPGRLSLFVRQSRVDDRALRLRPHHDDPVPRSWKRRLRLFRRSVFQGFRRGQKVVLEHRRVAHERFSLALIASLPFPNHSLGVRRHEDEDDDDRDGTGDK
jgi:hypothetical protein